MSLGEVREVSADVYAYLQPDGSWWLNNPVDLIRAFTEMVTYNGGQPLTCHA